MTLPGTLALVVGGSGSGKSALVDAARDAFPGAAFPVSCTTRPPRPGSKDARSFRFVTETEFDALLEAGALLEHSTYGGHRYGTLRDEILAPLAAGRLVIREVDVAGARTIPALLPEARLIRVFVDAGSWEHAHARIQARAPMDDAELGARRARYDADRAFAKEADVTILNCDGAFDAARDAFLAALRPYA